MSDDNDDDYLLYPHEDVLQQEFPDLWFEISAAFDGEPPAAIGDRLTASAIASSPISRS